MNYFRPHCRRFPLLLILLAQVGFAAEPATFPIPLNAKQLLSPDGTCDFVAQDGKPTNWSLDRDVLTVSPREEMNQANHCVSQYLFRDAEIHVEFLLPEGWTGNSGLYFHGEYELQIFNSHAAKSLNNKELGALYKFFPPLLNASKPPLEWQAYDVQYIAPRRNAEGKVTRAGTITAWLNGQMIHDRVSFKSPRSKHRPLRAGINPYLDRLWQHLQSTEQGPLFLQEHLSPVRFRNVWIRSLDGRAGCLDTPSKQKLVIGLIGDSTVSTTYGWGPAFAQRFASGALVLNYAENGGTLESLSKHLDELLQQKPNYVLLQFGHNDQKRYSTDAYGDWIRSYVERIREAGGQAIIVSPITRRNFDETGKITSKKYNDPNKPFKDSLDAFAKEALRVANELKTPSIDLHSLSVAHHNEIGPTISATYGPSPTDTTHFSKKGADAISRMVVRQLTQRIPEISNHLRPQFQSIKLNYTGNGFKLSGSGTPYKPWGHNYASTNLLARLEEDPQSVVRDFVEMKQAGTNVVRIHPEMPRIMLGANQTDPKALDRLRYLLLIAEQTGIRLMITGLACYQMDDRLDWYDVMSEQDRWTAQAFYWKAIARTCSDSPAVFAYDLVNEPAAIGQPEDGWYMGRMGEFDFCQRLTLTPAGRNGKEILGEWTTRMIDAIRSEDPNHLITMGMLPFPKAYAPIAPQLDFVSPHLYPKKGQVDAELNRLQEFDWSKPIVIGETFPLKCNAEDERHFLLGSRKFAQGWIGHWPKESPSELAELKQDRKATIQQAIWLSWVELFKEIGPTMLSPEHQEN